MFFLMPFGRVTSQSVNSSDLIFWFDIECRCVLIFCLEFKLFKSIICNFLNIFCLFLGGLLLDWCHKDIISILSFWSIDNSFSKYLLSLLVSTKMINFKYTHMIFWPSEWILVPVFSLKHFIQLISVVLEHLKSYSSPFIPVLLWVWKNNLPVESTLLLIVFVDKLWMIPLRLLLR